MIVEPVLPRDNQGPGRANRAPDQADPGEKHIPERAPMAGTSRVVTLSASIIREVRTHAVLRALLPIEVGCVSNLVDFRRETGADGNHATFVYCVHGEGWAEMCGRRHVLGPGTVLVAAPECAFAYGIDSEAMAVCWVHVTGHNSAYFVRELETTREDPIREVGENSQLVMLFQETLHSLESAKQSLPTLVYASQTVAHLLGKIVCLHHTTARAEADSGRRIKQSIAYMNQHLAKPVDVATLAALAHMSASHYTALFKRETGCAPIDFFIRLRMRQARQLLDETSLSVKQVAAELGYADPFYFSRVFKTVNCVSPSEYRAHRRSRPESVSSQQQPPQLAFA